MSSEQITQETVPVEQKTTTETETPTPTATQVADAGGKIAPLAKALPEEAKALVNAE